MYCLTRKTLKCNSFVQKMCLFLQKETSHCKNSLALGPQGLKRYMFGGYFYSKNTKKLKFHVFLLLHVRTYMISWFYLKCTEFIRIYEFCFNCGSSKTWIKLERIHNFLWIWSTLGKMMISYVFYVFINMEEYMEPELFGIFWVEMVAKNIVLGSPLTHFKHMRVKGT